MKISQRFVAPAVALAAVASLSAAGGATAAVLINGHNIRLHTVDANKLTAAAVSSLTNAKSISGVTIVYNHSSTSGSVGVQVRCPAGKRAIGGGGAINVNGISFDGSYPSSDGLGWWASGNNGSNGDLRVWVVCAAVH